MGDSADNDPELIRKFKEEFSVEEEGIFRATSYGLTSEVKSGLQFVDLADKDFNGYAPIHWACRNGKVDTLEVLVEAKADIEAPSNNGLRPLHLACNTIRELVVKKLVELGADVNATDDQGNTPLHWAARRGVNLTLRPLLDAKAELDARNDAGMTALVRYCTFAVVVVCLPEFVVAAAATSASVVGVGARSLRDLVTYECHRVMPLLGGVLPRNDAVHCDTDKGKSGHRKPGQRWQHAAALCCFHGQYRGVQAATFVKG